MVVASAIPFTPGQGYSGLVGTINDITSTDSSVTVTNPTGPVTNVEVPVSELNYTAITSSVNITDTSESTATALISPGAITFDGAAVIVEFFGLVQADTNAATDAVHITLFESSTQITRLALITSDITATHNIPTVYARFRFTPTAGSHTYKLCAFTTSTTGSPQIIAGAGGTNGQPPAFVRFSKV